jgi:hypothetical protein
MSLCQPLAHNLIPTAKKWDHPAISLFPIRDKEGFDGVISVGSFAASPPYDPATKKVFDQPVNPRELTN